MIIFPFNNKDGVVDYMTMATWGEIKDLGYDERPAFFKNNVHDFSELLVNVGDEGVNGFYLPSIIGLKDTSPLDEPRVELQNRMISQCLINKGKNQVPEFVTTNDFYNSSMSDDATIVPWYGATEGYLITPSYNFALGSMLLNFFPAWQSYAITIKYEDEGTLDEQIEIVKGLDSLTIGKDSHISILNAILYMNIMASSQSNISYRRHIGFYLLTKYGSTRQTGTLCSFSIGGNTESVFEKDDLEFGAFSARPNDHDWLYIKIEEQWTS